MNFYPTFSLIQHVGDSKNPILGRKILYEFQNGYYILYSIVASISIVHSIVFLNNKRRQYEME